MTSLLSHQHNVFEMCEGHLTRLACTRNYPACNTKTTPDSNCNVRWVLPFAMGSKTLLLAAAGLSTCRSQKRTLPHLQGIYLRSAHVIEPFQQRRILRSKDRAETATADQLQGRLLMTDRFLLHLQDHAVHVNHCFSGSAAHMHT